MRGMRILTQTPTSADGFKLKIVDTSLPAVPADPRGTRLLPELMSEALLVIRTVTSSTKMRSRADRDEAGRALDLLVHHICAIENEVFELKKLSRPPEPRPHPDFVLADKHVRRPGSYRTLCGEDANSTSWVWPFEVSDSNCAVCHAAWAAMPASAQQEGT